MSPLPWYYLEPPARKVLLRVYYAACTLTYPTFVALNWKSYLPDRTEVLSGRSLRDQILNPQNVKQ